MKKLVFISLGFFSIVFLLSFGNQADSCGVRTRQLHTGRRGDRKPVEWPKEGDCGKVPDWPGWNKEPDAFCDRERRYNKTLRIAGGQRIGLGQFPSYIRLELTLENDQTILCGGTLVAKDVVITSRNCLMNMKSGVAYAGVTSSDDLRQGQKRLVDSTCTPKEPQTNPPTNDIGMVRLLQPFALNKNVKPACILPESESRKTATCYFIGMGDDENGDNALKKLRVNRDCDYADPDIGDLAAEADSSEDRSCYQSVEDDRLGQPCPGDSGGPIICNRKCSSSSHQVVVASASYTGVHSCDLEKPRAGIFADYYKSFKLLDALLEKCFK